MKKEKKTKKTEKQKQKTMNGKSPIYFLGLEFKSSQNLRTKKRNLIQRYANPSTFFVCQVVYLLIF